MYLWYLMPIHIIMIDLIIFSMDSIIMVDTIAMVCIIMGKEDLDMDTTTMGDIDTTMEDVIEQSMEDMVIIKIEDITNVHIAIKKEIK